MDATIAHHSRARRCAPRRGSRTTHLRERQIAHTIHVTLVLAAALAVIVSALARPEPPQADGWTAVTVRRSDSLWAIAQSYPIDGLTTAETVDMIRTNNHLPSSVIMPGQTLLVPAEHDVRLAVASR